MLQVTSILTESVLIIYSLSLHSNFLLLVIRAALPLLALGTVLLCYYHSQSSLAASKHHFKISLQVSLSRTDAFLIVICHHHFSHHRAGWSGGDCGSGEEAVCVPQDKSCGCAAHWADHYGALFCASRYRGHCCRRAQLEESVRERIVRQGRATSFDTGIFFKTKAVVGCGLWS